MESCRIDKPWGFEDIRVHTPFYVVKLLNVTPGHGTSVQYHATKDEALTLSSGEISILLFHGSIDEEPERIPLLQGEWIRIPQGTVHRIESTDGGVALEVSTPELDDVVRLFDPYGR